MIMKFEQIYGLDKAIYDKCLNGYGLIEYNGKEDGDWWHNEKCPFLGCLPAPKHKLVDNNGKIYDNIKFIDGAWREVETYQEELDEGLKDGNRRQNE